MKHLLDIMSTYYTPKAVCDAIGIECPKHETAEDYLNDCPIILGNPPIK